MAAEAALGVDRSKVSVFKGLNPGESGRRQAPDGKDARSALVAV